MEKVTILRVAKITATWNGGNTCALRSDGTYEDVLKQGDTVVLDTVNPNWQTELSRVWVYKEGSRQQSWVHHLRYDKYLVDVEYEFEEEN